MDITQIPERKPDNSLFTRLEREQQLLADWRKANNGVISAEALLELFETVLRLRKSEAARER